MSQKERTPRNHGRRPHLSSTVTALGGLMLGALILAERGEQSGPPPPPTGIARPVERLQLAGATPTSAGTPEAASPTPVIDNRAIRRAANAIPAVPEDQIFEGNFWASTFAAWNEPALGRNRQEFAAHRLQSLLAALPLSKNPSFSSIEDYMRSQGIEVIAAESLTYDNQRLGMNIAFRLDESGRLQKALIISLEALTTSEYGKPLVTALGMVGQLEQMKSMLNDPRVQSLQTDEQKLAKILEITNDQSIKLNGDIAIAQALMRHLALNPKLELKGLYDFLYGKLIRAFLECGQTNNVCFKAKMGTSPKIPPNKRLV